MMTSRKEMAQALASLFPPGCFIYGGYHSQPKQLPYGNYARVDIEQIRHDDKLVFKKTTYIVRVVTQGKDFELEQKVEDLFEELELSWDLFDEAEVKTDKTHATEYAVEVWE